MNVTISSRSARFLIWGFPASTLLACALVLVPFWIRAKEEAIAMSCEGDLFGIGCLLRNYHESHGTYPPSSDEQTLEARVSWRVVTLRLHDPDLDGYDLGQAWDSSHNEPFITARIGRHFSCPSDSDARREGRASYLAVVGKGTVWSEVRAGRMAKPEQEAPNKIVVIEVPHSDIFWTEPRDISADETIALFRLDKGVRKGRHRRGLHFLTADGRTHDSIEIGSAEELESRIRVAE